MILSNRICYDTQPLFVSLSLIVSTEAVMLFIELPIKYIVSFDIRLPIFEGFFAYFRRLTFNIFRFFSFGGGWGGGRVYAPSPPR